MKSRVKLKYDYTFDKTFTLNVHLIKLLHLLRIITFAMSTVITLFYWNTMRHMTKYILRVEQSEIPSYLRMKSNHYYKDAV